MALSKVGVAQSVNDIDNSDYIVESQYSQEEYLNQLRAENEAKLQMLRIKNEKELLAMQVENETELERYKVEREHNRAKREKLIEKEKKQAEVRFNEERHKKELDFEKKLEKQHIKDDEKRELAKDKFREKLDKEYQKKRAKLEKEQAAKQRAEEYKESQEYLDKQRKAATRTYGSSMASGFGAAMQQGPGQLVNEILKTRDALKEGGFDKNGGLLAGIKAISGIAASLNSQIDSIASSKSLVDTRLQGSNNKRKWGIQGKSYWDQMSNDIVGIAGVSPFVKQEDVVNNLKSMISAGISFNVEQRAFLATIKDKIADTFDANDATLLRLIRIQEADSTASRLGMESAMTAFLNNMYENTEYLKGVAASVRQNIQEASALMTATDAVGFEYQVQKWMGSLYSVGFSKTSELSSALGKLAAGDISGLTGSGTGNLMIMAANQAGLSLGDVLAKGLDESSTNQLMEAMVNYLGGIYNESKDSRVVQQQMANVYGLAASDLKAAANILGDTSTISKNKLNYAGGIARLNQMAGTMYQRTSIGEMGSNMWSNLLYSMSAGIANNPLLYATYKASNLLDAFGGINIPAIMAVGNGANLNATVADLMKISAFSGGILSSMGQMIGLGSTGGGGGISGKGMLSALGIGNNITTISRGSGDTGLTMSNESTSSSTFVGNSDSSAVSNKTLTDANDDANKQLAAKQEEQTEATTTMINDNVISILELLRDVTTGALSFTTTENNFGLK